MRTVQPRRPWQVPVAADTLICASLARSRRVDVGAEAAALRAALRDRVAALDGRDDVEERLARLDAAPADASWTRWQTVVLVSRAWDDDEAIELAFALWDHLGEEPYRTEVRGEWPRPTIAERFAWPPGSLASDDGSADPSPGRLRAVARWAFFELPLIAFADLSSGRFAARVRAISALALSLAAGAAVGAAASPVLGRPVEDGAAAGASVALVGFIAFDLYTLILLAGLGLVAAFARRRQRRSGDQGRDARR